MPKPLYGDNGSGMHCHQSIWKAGKPLFADASGYAGLSQMCKWYIGGLLRHAPAILAFAAPTTNSYRRLVPGYEAPVNLAWSLRNRSAACRIPMYSDSPKAKRVEFRCPDPSCNPYLAFAAMLMAGLDGIRNKIDPGDPVDKNIYDLPPEEAAEIKQVPGSLEDSPGGARGRPRVPARGRRVHRRPDLDLHRLQELGRGRSDPAAAAPLRVLPLLRPLSAPPVWMTVRRAPGRRHAGGHAAVWRTAKKKTCEALPLSQVQMLSPQRGAYRLPRHCILCGISHFVRFASDTTRKRRQFDGAAPPCDPSLAKARRAQTAGGQST